MGRRIRRRIKQGRWRDFRGVLRPAGAVITGVAVAQAACAVIGGVLEWTTLPASEHDTLDVLGLLIGALVTGLVGVGAYLYGRKHGDASKISRREAILAVVVIWVTAGISGGVPFVISASMSPVDALFEAVSGMTTTGATVITHIEGLSMPILLWRSLIQWLGGMGIVVLFVAVFPSLGAGAKHMFKGEVPGTTAEGLRPRIAETAFLLWKIYAGFTLAEAVILTLLGMSPFEAVCHAFTTMSTGGFSTRDASVNAFDSFAIEMVIASFMFLGSVNYGLYHALLRRRSMRAVFRNTELRVFLVLCAFFVIALTLGNFAIHDHDLVTSFRYAYFMVGTTMSSTGYGTYYDGPGPGDASYMSYPGPMLMLVITMMFIGGCSGSTAGGIKVERIILMAKTSWAEFRESFRPAVVHVVRMGRTAVPPEILRDVAVFVGVYFACLGFGVLFVSMTDGVSLPTAFGATLTSLSNMGPGPFYEGSDNFASYSDAAKVFFVLAMLLGRLEFFTMFALLVPDFWRR